MKKNILVLLCVFLCLFSGFAQENNSAIEAKPEDFFSVSVIDEKILMSVPNYFSDASYQNLAGQKFKHKEVTQMLLSIPDNEKYIKQYRGWSSIALTLLGVGCAGLVTHTIYTVNEDLPNAESVRTAAMYGTILSIPFAVFSSSVAGLKYRCAVDNYNISIINQSKNR